MRLLRFGVIVVAVAGIWTTASADQLVLKNGDRVTGNIIKKEGKTVTIKTENFGVITAPWDQVASVTADTPHTIVVQGGNTVQGTLATSDGKVEVTAAASKLSVVPGELLIIRDADEQRAYERLLSPSWLDLWAGTATIGWAGTTGNAKTRTFTTGLNADRVTNADKTSVHFNSINGTAKVNGVTSNTAQAVRGGLGYSHNISSRLFINTFNDYEYDKFQNLDLRFVIGGGLGYAVIKTERSRFDVLGGAAYNRESFSTPLVRNSAEAYWGEDYSLKVSRATSLFQTFRMFNNLSDTGTYRINADVGASTKLTKWLDWNIALSDRLLSDPVPGRKKNDLLYTTGLGFIFAR